MVKIKSLDTSQDVNYFDLLTNIYKKKKEYNKILENDYTVELKYSIDLTTLLVLTNLESVYDDELEEIENLYDSLQEKIKS